MELEPFSFGVGDRFGHQAAAQLQAFERLDARGVTVVPVWNKSNREHTFIGSEPAAVWRAAKDAVEKRGWPHGWHVDADHIRLATVDRFLDSSDFFTIDVADDIGQPASEEAIAKFVAKHQDLVGQLEITRPHAVSESATSPLCFSLTKEELEATARKYLRSAQAAGAIYRHIANAKGENGLIAEVSMDETDTPQSPKELLIILAALADEGIRLQTIAPKFNGRFNKGVDYVGDLQTFEQEFRDDIAILHFASHHLGLPRQLKLSVHSGSDKFSLYPIIKRVLRETGAGIHLKTAGTTWLEELIGLAEAGGKALQCVKDIYAQAVAEMDALIVPYASVIDIQPSRLPSVAEVASWDGPRFAQAIRHVPDHPHFQSDMRQLLHIAFKLAAKAGQRYLDLLDQHAELVGQQVTNNLWERHLSPLFLD